VEKTLLARTLADLAVSEMIKLATWQGRCNFNPRTGTELNFK
jgi:hypothetical protein